MPTLLLHQIAWSEATWPRPESGLLALDNRTNPRPDWREYWPIRHYLLDTPLDDDTWYGFLSPKFAAKTGLDAAAVRRFVDTHGDAHDVLAFSPFFDQQAAYWNIFEQGEANHPGLMALAASAFDAIGLKVDLGALIMDHGNTVFCNYFVARPPFWRAWLDINERLFALCENDPASELSRQLLAEAPHGRERVHAKVFLMERIASLLLASGRFRCRAYDPYALPAAPTVLARFPTECLASDAMKVAYRSTGNPLYRTGFNRLRQLFLSAQARPPAG
jgi:hypothetical protein